MASCLNELTDQQLLNVLKAARELELDAAFIRLIESELVRRDINTNP
ncbi:sporulation histidine kinase inhibitor Sda [Paenibacillus sp. 1011MAR3C5]|nr:sporulation histidine kinase inhibitor Sda [Paenibacillus sp. 1011MAR3C5]RJE90716.1 sporulation histidine kinase inhibitor Sda [Paenibacillus sp. 1011MAR3C5]